MKLGTATQTPFRQFYRIPWARIRWGKLGLILGMVSTLQSPSAQADAPMTVIPTAGANLSGIVVSGFMPQSRSYSKKVAINWRASCFGANVRAVDNPLSPRSDLVMHLEFGTKKFDVICPAAMTSNSKASKNTTYDCKTDGPDKALVKAIFNEGQNTEIQLELTSTEAINTDGTYSVEKQSLGTKVKAWFEQRITTASAADTSRAYPPKNGILGSVQQIDVPPDGETIKISSTFAGMGGSCPQAGCGNQAFVGSFCGSYYSPLMLFFDEKRPHFTGKSRFPLEPGKAFYWVERDAPGYFLAIDRHHNGKITQADQLFGDNGRSVNGFEALKAIDSSGDQKIDRRDRIWKDLVLWRDRNGDGVSQKGEVHPLSALGVSQIDLRYQGGIPYHWGDRAAEFGHSTFLFRSRSGPSKQGIISDIWFTEAEE